MKYRVIVLNYILSAWLFTFCGVALAQSSFSQDVRGYDVESLVWAALMSLFGGALRTIFTLASDSTVVISIVRELWKDALVAMIAGTITYILVEALRASGTVPVPSEVRFAAIVFAGWSRLSFFGWLNKMGERVSTAAIDKVAGVFNGVAQPPAQHGQEPPKPKPFKEKQ